MEGRMTAAGNFSARLDIRQFSDSVTHNWMIMTLTHSRSCRTLISMWQLRDSQTV